MPQAAETRVLSSFSLYEFYFSFTFSPLSLFIHFPEVPGQAPCLANKQKGILNTPTGTPELKDHLISTATYSTIQIKQTQTGYVIELMLLSSTFFSF